MDHSLLMAKIRILTKKNSNRKYVSRGMVARLKDPSISYDHFIQSIRGRFEPLFDLNTDIDELYTDF